MKNFINAHNKINNDEIREFNEDFNKEFIESLDLKIKIQKFEGILDNKECDDATIYQTVWLKNIDRLIELIPKKINLSNYNLCDVGCGIGISTIYFQKKFQFKSYSGFDISEELIEASKKILKQLNLESEINLNVDNAIYKKLDSKPYVLFLFNPFGKKTLEKFINNNIKNLKKNKSIILYANDLLIKSIKYYKDLYRDDYFNLSCILF